MMKAIKSSFSAVVAAALVVAMPASQSPYPKAQPKSTSKIYGAGVDRARERLAAKRVANEAIPDLPVFTRQRARAEERRNLKRAISSAKSNAMRSKRKGGAAAVG